MLEMNSEQVELVGGGAMSTESKIIIGAGWLVSPVLGFGMTVGYYVNAK
ncbi:hypothetical protein ACODUO_03560 [Stenotrophomonas maltophilia]